MEPKDFAIGILIIGMVTMAGWVGFLYSTPLTKIKKEEETDYVFIVQEVPPTYESGLPDDWSNAPNASKIILHNETGNAVEITLGQILDYINKYEETSQHQYWYEKRLETITFNDPSGIPITGVDLLEVLRVFDCLYASEIELVSYNDTASKLTFDIQELCTIYGRDRFTMLALAANKEWLPDSLLGDRVGNFSIFSKDITVGEGEVEVALYNLANITVTKNWTVAVRVYNSDGTPNQTLELDYLNLTYNPTEQTYEYENTDWFNFNRTYYGTNLSDIVDYTHAKGTNYVLNFTFNDGATQPNSIPNRDALSLVSYFNWTDVEQHLANNGTHIVGNHVDLVNGGDNMLKTNLKMCLINKVRYHTEYDPSIWGGGIANYPWDEAYNEGYPPFQIIIPGTVRSRYLNGLTEITITILGPRT